MISFFIKKDLEVPVSVAGMEVCALLDAEANSNYKSEAWLIQHGMQDQTLPVCVCVWGGYISN